MTASKEGSDKTFFDRAAANLHDVGAVKTGEFTLKSGSVTPVYFDLRVIVSHPGILVMICHMLWEKATKLKFDLVCGVPYTALPFACHISVKYKIPMLMRRKEVKSYGTSTMVEGAYKPGQKVLIIEDVVTSGSSVYETAESLKEAGLKVTDVIVLLEREQGGTNNLKSQGINVHSICTASELLTSLTKQGIVEADVLEKYKSYASANQTAPLPILNVSKPQPRDSFGDRAKLCKHPITQKLLTLMEEKQTNLCVAADVNTPEELLKIADAVGPHICILKTHIDIVSDVNNSLFLKMKSLARKHKFLLFEDRKFADIGGTVQQQFTKGTSKISSWADIINTHILCGSEVQSLREVANLKEHACLVVAQMSSAANRLNTGYTKDAVKLATDNPDFVIGFISQAQLTVDQTFLHLTPGVNFSGGGDGKGQQYITPSDAILERGADIVIVGRGVTKDSQPTKMAQEYKMAAFEAYMSQIPTNDVKVENDKVEGSNNVAVKSEMDTSEAPV